MFTALTLLGLSLLSTSAVQARPHDKRATISNCKHDWSFTFDDGPYSDHVKISNHFTSQGAKASFFINGNNYRCIYDDDMVAAIKTSYNAGHLIASHSWSHKDLKGLSNAQIDEEIIRLDEALIRILGVKPNILRPPFGSITAAQVSYIEQTHKKTVVIWDSDSQDWNGGTVNSINTFYTNTARVSGPHLSLSHETAPNTFPALQAGTLTPIKNAGYTLVTTAQCLDVQPYTQVGAPMTKDSSWTCNSWVRLPTTTTTSTRPASTTSTRPASSTTTTRTSSAPTSTGTFRCTKNYTIKSGDLCYLLASNNGLTLATFQSYNPGINCNNLQIGQVVCIG